jgi:membrane-bound lytic murein transglycosylase D
MAEAQRLVGEGELEAAVQQTDEALCEVFDAPPGYPARQVYLDYLAELIDEADEIEAAAQHFGEEPELPEEMVILPPIDVVNVTAQVEETLEENPLPESDFPLVLNSTVEKFVSAMSATGEYNTRIAVGLQRSGTYLPMIRDRFKAAGLPVDLSYLPLIESAFSLTAYSRARAHGMWQFISSTARHYGLEVGSLIDERRDPERSTAAAVAYLGDLYQEFGDWQLALAAYNSGAGNVRRAIRRSESRDFWTLQKYLPRETRNYVPAFIASVIIAKNPAAFGFDTPDDKPWSYDSVDVPDALDLQFLASKSGVSLAELRELNPAIRRDLTPARTTTILRLPLGTADAVRAALDASPRSEWAPRMIHTVRSGDSLYTIARRYGSSVSEIRQANGLHGSLIHPGQNLIVPRFGSGNGVAADRSFSAGSDGAYVVQHNDTLWDIARGFSLSVDSLCEANGLSRRDVIRPGQRLRIPEGSARTAAASPRPAPAGPTSGYVVQSGDTLYDIARLHRVNVADLQRANDLRGSRIHPGDVLQIPQSARAGSVSRSQDNESTYRVKKGDTLFGIARRHGVSISELQRVNNLDGSRIYPGDVLRIPGTQAKG